MKRVAYLFYQTKKVGTPAVDGTIVLSTREYLNYTLAQNIKVKKWGMIDAPPSYVGTVGNTVMKGIKFTFPVNKSWTY